MAEMGLTQKKVADQLGVVPWTTLNWEKGRKKGWSIKEAAREIGVDPCTWNNGGVDRVSENPRSIQLPRFV